MLCCEKKNTSYECFLFGYCRVLLILLVKLVKTVNDGETCKTVSFCIDAKLIFYILHMNMLTFIYIVQSCGFEQFFGCLMVEVFHDVISGVLEYLENLLSMQYLVPNNWGLLPIILDVWLLAIHISQSLESNLVNQILVSLSELVY